MLVNWYLGTYISITHKDKYLYIRYTVSFQYCIQFVFELWYRIAHLSCLKLNDLGYIMSSIPYTLWMEIWATDEVIHWRPFDANQTGAMHHDFLSNVNEDDEVALKVDQYFMLTIQAWNLSNRFVNARSRLYLLCSFKENKIFLIISDN